VTGEGTDADWWRVAATACWRHLDESGVVVDVSDTTPPGPVRRLGAE
jgi:glycerol 3-phosphatase-2